MKSRPYAMDKGMQSAQKGKRLVIMGSSSCRQCIANANGNPTATRRATIHHVQGRKNIKMQRKLWMRTKNLFVKSEGTHLRPTYDVLSLPNNDDVRVLNNC